MPAFGGSRKSLKMCGISIMSQVAVKSSNPQILDSSVPFPFQPVHVLHVAQAEFYGETGGLFDFQFQAAEEGKVIRWGRQVHL